MANSMYYHIRKNHSRLGLSLGIQFLLWTIGGLYFSWSNLNEVPEWLLFIVYVF